MMVQYKLNRCHMEPEGNDAPFESKAFDLLTAGDVAAAVATITASRDSLAAMDALARLCQRAYRELKSVPTMTAVAWEAIGFGLQCAAASPDPESARRYTSGARAIAYNAGANCWPGWGDAVEISPADVAEGLKLAGRNYQLVAQLALGDKAMGAALWLIGALEMAAGRLGEAIGRFRSAEEAFHAAQLPAQEAMARGYALLAAKLLPASHFRSTDSLEAVLLSLRAMGSPEAQFFAGQLATADRIFSER